MEAGSGGDSMVENCSGVIVGVIVGWRVVVGVIVEVVVVWRL